MPWPTQHIETPARGRARTGQHSGRPALSSCGSGDVCEEGRHSPRQEPGRRRRGAALLGQGQRGPGVRHPAVAGRPTPGVSGGGWEADRPPSAVRRSWSGLEGPSGAWTSARRRPLFLRRGVVGHQLDPESRCDRPRVLQELPAAPRTGRKGPGQRRRRPRPRGERHRLRPVHRAPTPEPQEQSEGSPGRGAGTSERVWGKRRDPRRTCGPRGARSSGVRGAAALRDSARKPACGAKAPRKRVGGHGSPGVSPHRGVHASPAGTTPGVSASAAVTPAARRPQRAARRASPSAAAGGRRPTLLGTRTPRWRLCVLPWASLAWTETAPGSRRRPPALELRAARPALEAAGVCRVAVPSGAVYARARHRAVGTRPPRPWAQWAQPGDGQVH